MTAMPRDPDIAIRLMLALGGVIIRCADFETDMQGVVRVIHERRLELGHHDDAELPPDKFTAYIKYLRKHTKLAGIEPFAAEIKRITSKVKEITKIRNFIAHGTLSHFDETTQTVRFRKYRLNDEDAAPFDISLADLEARCSEIATLAAAMADLNDRMQQALLPDTGSDITDP